jgi:hypothetical protein
MEVASSSRLAASGRVAFWRTAAQGVWPGERERERPGGELVKVRETWLNLLALLLGKVEDKGDNPLTPKTGVSQKVEPGQRRLPWVELLLLELSSTKE